MRNPRRISADVLVQVAGIVVTVVLVIAVIYALLPMGKGPTDTAIGQSSCTTAPPKGTVGVSTGAAILSLPDADMKRELGAMKNAGVRSVRVDVDWSLIEAKRGSLNWTATDRVMNAIAAAGMCPLPVIGFTPLWATFPADNADDGHFRPRDPALFGAFVKTAATRYRSSTGAWEIWNEPNIVNFFKPAPDVTAYGRLLAAADAAIASVSSSLKVVSGGLAPAADNGRDIAPVTFVTAMYKGGFNRYFDAVATHPYSYPYLPNDPATTSFNAAQQMWPMHDVMVNGGDGSKKIWMTEFGAPTGTSRVAVTPDFQAQTIQIVLDAGRDVPWLGPAYVYNIRDTGGDTMDPEQNFGLLYRDFTPKPAYQVVARYAS